MKSESTVPTERVEPIERLTRDLKTAARTLSDAEARYLVDSYYQMQEQRIRAAHQIRQMRESGEPHEVIAWFGANTDRLERQVAAALDVYTDAQVVGRWSRSIVGIGPILASGLLAHIDIAKAPTVGHIWRFAGLDPTQTWDRGKKRPWNARLKTLCWKIGESFVKFSGHEKDVYGKLYLQRKALEVERNDAGAFADQAAASLSAKQFHRDTATKRHYESGKLPPARLHLRAQRWAVKIFLAHWHHIAYRARFGVDPPKPYVLSQLGHAHEIGVPNWPF